MAEQSPWGNQNKNNNPPNDPFKDFSKKLKNIISGGAGKPPEKNGESPLKNNKRSLILFALLLLIVIVSYTSVYQIQPGEKGVVTRFGQYIKTSESGLNFLIPFVEKMQRVNVDIIRKEEFGFTSNSAGVYVRKNNSPTYTDEESLMLTGDKNVINLNWVVQYRIISPKNYLFNIADISGTVRDISETVLRRLVGNRDFDYVLNNREELAYAAKSEMQLFLDKYESGIALEAVQLLDVTPPEPVRPSFNEVNEADQDRTRLVNEAQREYNEKIPRARGEAKQLIQEAEGYKVRRVNTAEGEVARYNEVYTQYKRYPSVTRQRIYIETLREVLPGVNEILVVDQNKNIVPLLNLSGTGSVSQVPASSAATQTLK